MPDRTHRHRLSIGSWPLGPPTDPRFYSNFVRAVEQSGFDTDRLPEGTPKLPLMYSLRARKPEA